MSSQSQNPSRRKNALLRATAARAPSAMAAATKRTSRDTSPAIIYARDTSLLRIGVHHDATLCIPLAAKTLRKVRCLMAAGREEQAGPGQIRSAFEYDLRKYPVRAFETLNGLGAHQISCSSSFRIAFALISVPSLQTTTSWIQCFIIRGKLRALIPFPQRGYRLSCVLKAIAVKTMMD